VKIGLVLESFDPKKGGLEQWTWQFAGRLIEAGHELHIIACSFAPWKTSPSPQLHPVPHSSSPRQRAAAMAQVLQELNLDVVHDMGTGWQADLFHPHGGSSRAFQEHNLMRIPRWRQIRFWRQKRYREHAEIEDRQHANEKALIVAVSEMVREHFRKLHGVPQDRIRLIPNGVDTDRFSPQSGAPHREQMRLELNCRDHETLFLLIANNLPLKNAKVAIEALARLIAKGTRARLVIVGGRRPKPFVRLVDKLGLADRVAFISPVEDVRPYYAAADVYLHPTWYDPCSLVALEALACGLPVITTRYNGVSEIITDGEQGFLLDDPADLSTLTDQMRTLSEPETRLPMGLAARALALNHTLDRQTESFLALYRELAPESS
jgi:UDP-glucose:(heptosyl)LPS alpha-1,3-glucosyltransferase